jgi:uncharacterized membrane protein YdjX (TVP38/TMEM64 family)
MNFDRDRDSRAAMRGGVIVGVAALLLMLGALLWWMVPILDALGIGEDVGTVVELIRSWGSWGVAGSIGLMVAHSFVPFPAEIVALANGMLYGALWGTVITWSGAMLGASAAFALGRALGRPFVDRMLRARGRERLAAWTADSGTTALLIGRLIPVIAFNLINYAASLTPVSWWTFLWTTGVGILPFTIVLSVFGDEMLSAPGWIWIAIAAFAALTWILMRRYRRAKAL